MYRRTIALCLAVVFVLVGMTQVSLASHKTWRSHTPLPPAKMVIDQTESLDDTLLFEDFESGVLPAGWETIDNLAGIHWHISDWNAYEGNSYWCGDEGNSPEPPDFIPLHGYQNMWYQTMTTPPIAVGSAPVTLTFMHNYSFEDPTQPNWDGSDVRVSTNGQFTTANIVEPDSGVGQSMGYTSDPNLGLQAHDAHGEGAPPGQPDYPGFAAASGGWYQEVFDLSAFAGQTIQIRYTFLSDWGSSVVDDESYTGAQVDNFEVTDASGRIFYDNAGDNGSPLMTFGIKEGVGGGDSWTISSDNQAIYPDYPTSCNFCTPQGWRPGAYSANADDWILVNNALISAPVFLPEEGFPELKFNCLAEIPGSEWDDDGTLDDYYHIELSLDGLFWTEIFYNQGSGYLDSTWTRWTSARDQNLKLHDWNGQSIRIRWQMQTDDTEECGTGCDDWCPCEGRGLFVDDIYFSHRGKAGDDVGVTYIYVPYPTTVGCITPVQIVIPNQGVNNKPVAIVWYEILDEDRNPLPGYPQPMGPPWPAIAPDDTFFFNFDWTPGDTGLYYWRAFNFMPDDVPQNDTLTTRAAIRVQPEKKAYLSYLDRFVSGGSGSAFPAGNGPAIRYSVPDCAPGKVTLDSVLIDIMGPATPFELYIFGEGDTDSTWGDPLIEPFLTTPESTSISYLVDLTERPDYDNLKGIDTDWWVHIRTTSQTLLSFAHRDDPLEQDRYFLYFDGQLQRRVDDGADVACYVSWAPEGCVGLRGDATGDGNINVLDVLAVANHILGVSYLTGDGLCRGDCTGDAQINILDALGVANVILGIIPACPGGGACKPVVTPETMEFMKSLEAYLSPEGFAQIMTLVKNEVGVPQEYSLAQNYPNPFNPTTTIEYTVAGNVHTELTVYNVLGQEVASLVDEMKTAGAYTVEWDAADLASGIYFYRLTAGDYTATRQMVLMK